MENLDFDNLNLNYLLLTSELASYNDREYYSMNYFNSKSDIYSGRLIYEYRHTTIGYVEQEIAEVSDGEFNAIKPIVVDGVPQYIFINHNDEFNSRILPHSALYEPIVIDPERFDEVMTTRTVMSIEVKCNWCNGIPYSFDTEGINPYDLDSVEAEIYGAKIPLNDDEFNYPITQLAVRLIKEGQNSNDPIMLKEWVLEDDSYIINNGNIYFKENLESLLFDNRREFRDIVGRPLPSEKIYYQFDIEFEFIIADDGSELHTQMALSQATNYLVLDYFNQYTFAQTTAQMISEIAYTEHLTLLSTEVATAFIIFGSYATGSSQTSWISKAAETAASTVEKVLIVAASIATIMVLNAISEVFQEIIIDAFIETHVERIVELMGGDEMAKVFWSSIVTSAREGIMGAMGKLVHSITGTNTQTNTQTDTQISHQQALDFNYWVLEQGNGRNLAIDIDYQQEVQEEIARRFGQEGDISINDYLDVNSYKKIFGSSLFKGIAYTMTSIFFSSSILGMFGLYGLGSLPAGMFNSITGKINAEAQNEKMEEKLQQEILKALIKHPVPIVEEYGPFIRAWNALTGYSIIPKPDIPLSLNPNPMLYTSQDVDFIVQDKLNQYETIKNPQIVRNRPITNLLNVKSFIERMEAKTEVFQDNLKIIKILSQIKKTQKDLEQKIHKNSDTVSFKKEEQIYENKIENKDINFYKFRQTGAVITSDDVYIDIQADLTPAEAIQDLKNKKEINSILNWKFLLDGKVVDITTEKTFAQLIEDQDPSTLILMGEQAASSPELDLIINQYNDVWTPQQQEAVRTVFENCHQFIKRNTENFKYLIDNENFGPLALRLVDLTNYIMSEEHGYHTDDLVVAEAFLLNSWTKIGRENGLTETQILDLQEAAVSIFKDQVLKPYNEDKELSKSQIERAFQIILLEELIKLDGPASGQPLHALEKENVEIFIDTLISYVETIRTNPNINLPELYSLSVLSCVFHSSSFTNRGQLRDNQIFSYLPYIDTGVQLEVLSVLSLLPIQITAKILDGYQWQETIPIEIHNQEQVQEVKRMLYGPFELYLTDDYSAFDIFGRHWFKRSDGKWSCIVDPSKNFQQGKRNFETSLIGRDNFRNIYQTMIDILKDDHKNIDNVVFEICDSSPMFNQNNLDLQNAPNFIRTVLGDLVKRSEIEMNGRRVDKNGEITQWDVCSKSDNAKKALFEVINNKIAAQLDTTQNDGEAFLGALYTFRDDFEVLNTIREDVALYGYRLEQQEIRDKLYEITFNFRNYYGCSYDAQNNLRFGLVLRASIGTYTETNELLFRRDIPYEIEQNSDILSDDWEMSVNGMSLKGTWALMYRMENGRPIHKLIKLNLDSPGNILTPDYNENDLKEGWVFGAAYIDSNGNIRTHPQALITLNGQKIFNGIYFENEQVKYDGVWNNEEKYWNNLYRQVDGLNKISGVQVLNVMATSYGAQNKIILSKAVLTSNWLKYGKEWKYSGYYFTDESWITRQERRSVSNWWTFYDYEFINDPNYWQILQEAKEFKEALFQIHRRQIDDFSKTKNPEILAISEDTLRKLNEFQKGEEIIEGKGYKELSKIFTKLLGNVKYDVPDSLAYKLTNIRFIGDNIRIQETSFRGQESNWNQKKWLRTVLYTFKDYVNKIPSTKDGIDQLLYDTLITQNEQGNDISVFNMEDPKLSDFSPDSLSEKLVQKEGYDDIALAEKVVSKLLDLVGRYTLYKMITGTVFIQHDSVRFASYTKTSSYKAHQLMLLELAHKRHYSQSRPEQIMSYWLDSLYSAYVINFDAEKGAHNLIVSGIPIENVDPMYRTPSLNECSDFYSQLSLSLTPDFMEWYNIYGHPYTNIKGIDTTMEGISTLWTILNDIYLETLLQKYDLDNNLMFHWSILGQNKLISRLITESSEVAKELRKDLMEYFNLRGSKSVELKIYKENDNQNPLKDAPLEFYKLKLTPAHWELFEDHDDVISNSLYVNFGPEYTTKSLMIPTSDILNLQMENIIEIGKFLKELVYRAKKLGLDSLRIYGYRAYKNGFGFDPRSQTYRPERCSPDEYDIYTPGKYPLNSRYFTLDLENLDQFDFHLFLGAMLADNQVFIVRAGIDSNGNPLMWRNEILFAFSFLTKDIFPDSILSDKTNAERPSWAEFNNGLLYPHNLNEYIILNELWSKVQENFIKNQVFISSHKFKSHLDWYRACIIAGLPPSLDNL